MNKLFSFIFLMAFSSHLFAATTTMTGERILSGKKGSSTNVTLEANTNSANKPKLIYDKSDSKWKFSNDGTTTTDLGSGSGSSNAFYALDNLGLSATVAANALTVALKQADGSTDPSSGASAVNIGFRSSTLTSGAYNLRSVTGALSVVVPSATTIGTQNGVQHYLFVYALDNAGTVELAVSLKQFSDASVQSTSAISGGTSPSTMYSTTARSNVPVRLIGRINITEATAGTWATSPTEVALLTKPDPVITGAVAESGLTFVGSSVTNASVWSWREGELLHVRGNYTIDTPNGTTTSLTLPTKYTIKSSVFSSSVSTQGVSSRCSKTVVGSSGYGNGNLCAMFYDGSAVNSVFFAEDVGSSVYTKKSGTSFWASGQVVDFEFAIPINTWSAPH